MFNMMNQGMMGGQNPFMSPMSGGMPQVMNAAPQIPVRQAPGGAAPMPTPAPTSGQQPQQKGFFGNMTSSPLQMQAGMNLGNKAYDGISGMFGGSNPAIDPSTIAWNNPAGAPFSASVAGPPMPALASGAASAAPAAATPSFFSSIAPGTSLGAGTALSSIAAPTAAVSAIPAAAAGAGTLGAGMAAGASALPSWLSSLLLL